MRSSVGCALWFGLAASLALILAGAGCGLGQSGINPPTDQIFLPSGLAVDPDGQWLYVVNSNDDLRFNAGTLLPVNLTMAKNDRDRGSAEAGAPSGWPPCSTSKFRNDKSPETLADRLDQQPCCVDLERPHVLNCNERAYARADATVQIGSFGGMATIQPHINGDGAGVVNRIFLVVRADPSITFIDVSYPDGLPSLRCTGARGGAVPDTRNPFCDDNWRIRRPSGASIQDNVFPEEPHSLILDPSPGQEILYVSHLTFTVRNQLLGGGISTIDAHALLDPEAPNVINSIARVVFPTASTQAVTAMSLSGAGGRGGILYAVSRATPSISGMVLQCQLPGQHCDPGDPSLRDLSLVPGEQITESTFLPAGTDIRGFLLSADGNQAYVLHRNTPELSNSADPAALVVLNRRPGLNGMPANQASTILEVCTGPTDMQFHDAGNGNLLFITCYEGGQIYVVDPEEPAVVSMIEAGHGPTALTFSPADKTVAYVADYADNNVSVIDLAPGSPTEYMVVQRLGFPHAVTE